MCRIQNEELDPIGHKEEDHSYKGVRLWVGLRKNLLPLRDRACSLTSDSVFASGN